MSRVVKLNTYPIKGLSPQSLDQVTIAAGNGFPHDRFFGLARADSGFDPENPQPLPKERFLVLAQVEKLARLKSHFDPETATLGIDGPGIENEHFDLGTPAGRERLAKCISDFLDLPENEEPIVAEAHPHRFTDVSVVSAEMMNAISLINLDSVEQLSKEIGTYVDPQRFRGNILISGQPAFSELDLVGQEIRIGEVRFEVMKRTKRCPATEVDPATSQRDIKVPHLLRKHFGHFDMGVYIKALENGVISAGAEVTFPKQ